MNHKEFLSNAKSLLIAPAGYGKTHLITECLQHTEGKQLILTHTHAGVASIKEKLLKSKLPAHKFHIETITGYAQKYVLAYCWGIDIPPKDNSSVYYHFLVEKAKALLKYPIVQRVIKASYTGLFVDEYQDCTLLQHSLILTLSDLLPTRILGDPLQGIFSFDGSSFMVNLEDAQQMGDFHQNKYELHEPWRWKKANASLGEALKGIRLKVQAQQAIHLDEYTAIEYVQTMADNDLYNPKKKYYSDLTKLLKSPNVLILHPESASVHARKKIVANFKVPIKLIEAIDDKSFYDLSNLFDNLSDKSVEEVIYTVCQHLFNRTEVNKWISAKGARRRLKEAKPAAEALSQLYGELADTVDFNKCASLLRSISHLPGVRCYRKELFHSLCGALDEAAANATGVHTAMIEKRNLTRRVGRKVYGRCIGTTLLTKGLEFDTVVVLNAHRFSCPRNLYVALTRACKRLVVFSSTPILSPYPGSS